MQEFDEAAPFIRTGVALLLFMKFGSQFGSLQDLDPMKASVKKCYYLADQFVGELKKDFEASQDGLAR